MVDWLDEFKRAGAVWLHGGDPVRPHAELTSGLHSDGFVNCTFVTQRPNLLNRILRDERGLAGKLPNERADWVIGSAFGAIAFAHAVAERLETRAGFTEKDGDGMALKRFELKPRETVLVVEDVISTGGSTLKTIAGLRAAGGETLKLLPMVLCLVNRSGQTELGGFAIKSLLELSITSWDPKACPLCAKGSPALRPKTHWKELRGL
ncbi:MAG: orotate phosphoribosyltransferase [Planctomycetota bacterium]|nr:orotate phosphoribosyltransferase [Planctomycetota bacterium]